jgi:hypothetical protein
MEGNDQAKRELELKLKGVMNFYVSTYFEHYSSQIKNQVAKNNPFVETDIMEARIDDTINTFVEEATMKFHDVCMLILDTVIAGQEYKVREFEVLFIDLVKRTLVEHMQNVKRSAPIVIIADPNVKAGEN